MNTTRRMFNNLFDRIFVNVDSKYKNEFFQKKFLHNNFMILILSAFLAIEQMYYGLRIHQSEALLQNIHFSTALAMMLFFISAIHIHIKHPNCTSKICKIYELGFGLYGFFISIARSLLVHTDFLSIPTIYIAVLYGFAVIFYFHPLKSLAVYGITSISLIFLLPAFQPEIVNISYVPDILSNNLIAWMASAINYKKYVTQFNSQKTIDYNNSELKRKNTEIEKMNKKLKEISARDPLTNLFNRRKLDEMLETKHEKSKIQNSVFSIIMIDIDFFKSVNDKYGHDVGDKVLIDAAYVLKTTVRHEVDIVGRWGGEEFLVICPDTDKSLAVSLSEKIRKAIETYNFPIEMKITASLGVATSKGCDTACDIVNRADIRMYKAKSDGRNKVEHSFAHNLYIQSASHSQVLEIFQKPLKYKGINHDIQDIKYNDEGSFENVQL